MEVLNELIRGFTQGLFRGHSKKLRSSLGDIKQRNWFLTRSNVNKSRCFNLETFILWSPPFFRIFSFVICDLRFDSTSLFCVPLTWYYFQLSLAKAYWLAWKYCKAKVVKATGVRVKDLCPNLRGEGHLLCLILDICCSGLLQIRWL